MPEAVDLASQFAILREEVAMLRQAVGAGGSERPLSLSEVSVMVGKSPRRLRVWRNNPELCERYAMDVLLPFKLGKEWSSTPRRIQKWLHTCAKKAAGGDL
ncbi:MAG: hypothetical protein ABIQ65_20710 [Thermoanaerobaculia bacterium]